MGAGRVEAMLDKWVELRVSRGYDGGWTGRGYCSTNRLSSGSVRGYDGG